MLLMRGSYFLTLAVDPRVQREATIGMLDECLDMSLGLRTPTALLDGGVLADEEPKREIGTPLLDRLDHGEAAAGRRMVQQCRTELHRVLCHVWHEPLHVGNGENGADRVSRAVPFRWLGRHKPAGAAHERLQPELQRRWVPRVVIEKLFGNCQIARYEEGFGERPKVEVEQI